MTDQFTEDRKHKGPFPYTARKVAQALTDSIDDGDEPFMSATIANEGPAVLIDTLDITEGTYGKSFIVTVRDVDDERPEDKLDRIRDVAKLLSKTGQSVPETIAKTLLGILDA